jgi:alkylated DNA repair dioxygenase AlkB
MAQSDLITFQLTEKSFISLRIINNAELLIKCIAEITNSSQQTLFNKDKVEIYDKLIKNPPITVYGKTAYQHRSIGFFSNESVGYKYSGQMAKSQSLTPNLTELLNLVNKLYNASFNGILVNRYDDGNDYIGAHSDDESALDDIGVVCISYGAVRKFRIRDKITKDIIKDIPTEQNMFLHMGGEFQKEFTHEIPVEKKVKGTRYSFTFRKHLE